MFELFSSKCENSSYSGQIFSKLLCCTCISHSDLITFFFFHKNYSSRIRHHTIWQRNQNTSVNNHYHKNFKSRIYHLFNLIMLHQQMPFEVWYGGEKHSNNAESENGLRSIKTITALGNKKDLIGWRGGLWNVYPWKWQKTSDVWWWSYS